MPFLIPFAALAMMAGLAIYETIPAARSGIGWRHDNALTPRRRLPESIGPGVAMLDYDGDGWLDLYFGNSGGANALYRNEGGGAGGFREVTAKAGVAGRGFGLGVATCDYNGDGRVDLFVTNHGSNILYRNDGDGAFTDVTKVAGLSAPGLWTAAVFFDADGDGDQDLFAGHFVRYDPEREPECVYGGRHHYCHPLAYEPWPSRLYRNNGDGTFADSSAASGIGRHPGKVFGAVAADIDNDGRLDLFVANDSVANFLFHNQGGGVFSEIGLEAGVAYSADGNPRSGMGVDAGDFDGDGRQDLFVANFNRERFSIYRNRGKRQFSDEAGSSGIGMATQMYSGWGVKFFDFDLDGDMDLIVCTSHPDDQIEKLSATLKFQEPLLLFENQGGGKFEPVGARAGEAFARDWPGRGLAVGDLNNDGLPDIVVGMTGAAPLLLQHASGPVGRWLGLDLGLAPAGARVSWQVGGRRHNRSLTAGGSYLSAHDPRVVLGLGEAARADWVEVAWPAPSPRVDRAENLAAGRYYRWRRGGKPE